MNKKPEFAKYTSYMMTSYVKYIEARGARVIPILYQDSKEVILDKLSKVNGVLYPGGGGDYYDQG
jgi:gamma-glutamyl hydrolase